MDKNLKIDFIGIGATKSATSWIFKCLLEHPEICGYRDKEAHFFEKDENYNKGLDYYAQLFSHCPKDKIIGEYTPGYLYYGRAAERIKKHFPNIKLLVCLRNPVARTYSNILHFKSVNQEHKNKSLKEIKQIKPFVFEKGYYSKYLKNYLALFPRENLLILFYDDIKKNPLKFIKKIYNFLGVDSSFVAKGVNLRYHSAQHRFSNLYKKINNLYRFFSKYFFGKYIIKTAKLFRIDSYFINKMITKLNKKKKNIASKEEKQYLYSLYKEEIDKLEALLDKDLSLWKQD